MVRGPTYKVGGHEMWVIETDTKICEHLKRGHFWEPEIAAAIERYADPDWTFVDLVAHIGSFTLLASRRFKQVIAVEANPAASEVLWKNVDWNELTNVEVHECAVWGHDGEVSFMPQVTNTGSSWVASRKKKPDAIAVPAKSLSTILGERRPEFWKIDIEGAEYQVFKDCPEVLEKAEVIITEYCASQLDRTSNATGRQYYDLLSDFCWHRMNETPISFEELPTGAYDNFLLFRR